MTRLLNKYLLSSKTWVNDTPIDLLVMGNEAADLDSMASAIAFAYIRAMAQPDKTIIPLMPIRPGDFKLRPEAIYVFEQAGIDPGSLVFIDDIMPQTWNRVNGLALVDHNKLSGVVDTCPDKVKVILDHHKDEGLYPHASPRVIEPVGSTATLVGEILIRDFPHLQDTGLTTLLTGTILLDTVNLDPGSGRVTDKDIKILRHLMDEVSLDRDLYYKKIRDAKFDIAGLTTADLLRKDYKEFESGKIRWGIASALIPLDGWGQKDNELCLGFQVHARQRKLDVLVSMNAYENPDFSRDLAVYCTDSGTHVHLQAFLQKKGLGLKNRPMDGQKPCMEGEIAFYTQADLRMSRKKLAPLLEEYFTG